jgi:hypothetical protein
MSLQRLVVTRLANPVVAEIRGLLGDFISSGLAEELSWLDVGDPTRVITQGVEGDHVVALDDWMSDHLPSVSDLRMVVFQPLVDGFSPVYQDELQQKLQLSETLTKGLSNAASVLVPSADAKGFSEEIFSNRVNLVISPTDGRSPMSPSVRVEGDGDRYFGHAATSLISVLGSWTGQNDFPIADFLQAAGRTARPVFVVRSYVRHIDASGLVGSVIEQALAVSNGAYLTYDQQGIAFSKVQPHAQQGVIREVAKEFIGLNKAMLTLGPGQPFKSSQRTGRTFGELLREYLSFMGSILQTPGTWARTKFNEISGAAATKVQSAFLGKDSEYEIFVNGVSGLDSNLELDAVSQLVGAADSIRGNVQRPPAPNPGNLWSELTNTSCSLVDASELNIDIQMPGVAGGARDVITTPSFLVRSDETEVFLISPSLPIPLAGKLIKPSDPYLYVLTQSQIEDALAKSGNRFTNAQQNNLMSARVDLEAWGANQGSFLWAVGLHIANGLNEARKALLPQSQQMDDELDQKMLVDLEVQVRKKFMRIILGALGITLLGGLAWLAQALYLYVIYEKWPSTFIPNWGLPLFIFLGLLLLWMSVTSIIFDKGMRDLFALRNRRMEARRRLEHSQQQRAYLLQEILRLGEVYSQFQAWTSLLTPPIVEPVSLEERGDGALGKIRISDLPSSFSQGRLTEDSAKVTDLSDRVRHQYFSIGWLWKSITGFLESLGADTAKIWQESPSDARSSLNRALENLSKESEEFAWRKRSAKLARSIAIQSANYQSWPLATDFGKGKIVDSSAEFMQELASGDDSLPGALLTDETTVARENRLDPELSRLYVDSRLALNASVTAIKYEPFAKTDGRELDLMAIRIDTTGCLSPANLTFISAKKKAIVPENIVSSSEEEPEA